LRAIIAVDGVTELGAAARGAGLPLAKYFG